MSLLTNINAPVQREYINKTWLQIPCPSYIIIIIINFIIILIFFIIIIIIIY